MRVNISYGKIENGVFAYAPYRLDIEGKQIYNGTAEQYAAGGWLPVVHTPQPDVGNYTAAFAEQDGQIVETWALQSTETEE